MSVLSVEWRWERWGEPTKTADRGWNGPLYGRVSRIPPVHTKKPGAKPDRLLGASERERDFFVPYLDKNGLRGREL